MSKHLSTDVNAGRTAIDIAVVILAIKYLTGSEMWIILGATALITVIQIVITIIERRVTR